MLFFAVNDGRPPTHGHIAMWAYWLRSPLTLLLYLSALLPAYVFHSVWSGTARSREWVGEVAWQGKAIKTEPEA